MSTPIAHDLNRPLLSEFADDPDMADLLELFVGDLPQRITDLQQAVAQSDMALLARLTHQLKGSAGGYGYGVITQAAAAAEQQVKQGQDVAHVRQSVDQLVKLCQLAIQGAK